MAQCKRCLNVLPDEALFCMFCGNKLGHDPRKGRRGNGQGSVRKRGNTYEARITVGWKFSDDGHKVQIFRTKGGFYTRKDAMDYINTLRSPDATRKAQTLQQIWERWRAQKEPHVDSVTMAGYRAAYRHFSILHPIAIDKITVNMLQECVDRSGKGRRMRELMKTTSNQLFDYAIDDNQIIKNPAKKINLREDDKRTRPPITEEELATIYASFDTEPYAPYVYALCYLGYRPAEFFSLTKSCYHETQEAAWLVAGIKTEAGRNRPVTIPPRLVPIIRKQLALNSIYIFPRMLKTGEYIKMSVEYFREHVFKPMMFRLGIEGRVPYSARHTYADKIKKAAGADRDKAALIGHSDYSTTKRHYQSTNIKDRKSITDQL